MGVWLPAALAAASSFAAYLLAPPEGGAAPPCGWDGSACPGACARLAASLSAHLVGQELASSQAVDAVCDFLADPHPARPVLVLALHGPPGVGKTLFHGLLAEALYNASGGGGGAGGQWGGGGGDGAPPATPPGRGCGLGVGARAGHGGHGGGGGDNSAW